MWQSVWLSVLSCGSVCRSCVTVIARLASTHTALVSQSLVGLCFAFPSINQCISNVYDSPGIHFVVATGSHPGITVIATPGARRGRVMPGVHSRVVQHDRIQFSVVRFLLSKFVS